jgi:hypothetical protein
LRDRNRLFFALAAVAMLLVAAGTTSPARALTPPESAAAGTSSGAIGVHLLDAPTDRFSDPRAHEYIIDHLPPGSAIRRRIQVTSTAATPLHLDLYPAAATVEHGVFDLAADHTPDELSTWVKLDVPSLDLPPYGTKAVGATITVPREASPGERYAVIWAQVAAPADPSGGGIRMVSRAGVRVYLDIGPGGEPPSDFEITSLTPGRMPDGEPEVLAQVRNTGQRALDMTGTLSLSDGPASLSAGPFPARLGTTLGIGDSEAVTVPLDQRIPDGPWKVRLTLASGMVEHTVTATLTFPDSGVGRAVKASRLLSSHTIAWSALIALGAAGTAGLAFRRSAVRRRRAR